MYRAGSHKPKDSPFVELPEHRTEKHGDHPSRDQDHNTSHCKDCDEGLTVCFICQIVRDFDTNRIIGVRWAGDGRGRLWRGPKHGASVDLKTCSSSNRSSTVENAGCWKKSTSRNFFQFRIERAKQTCLSVTERHMWRRVKATFVLFSSLAQIIAQRWNLSAQWRIVHQTRFALQALDVLVVSESYIHVP